MENQCSNSNKTRTHFQKNALTDRLGWSFKKTLPSPLSLYVPNIPAQRVGSASQINTNYMNMVIESWGGGSMNVLACRTNSSNPLQTFGSKNESWELGDITKKKLEIFSSADFFFMWSESQKCWISDFFITKFRKISI